MFSIMQREKNPNSSLSLMTASLSIYGLNYSRSHRGAAWLKIQFFWQFFLDIDIDIFVNCNWVDTRWQQYSTHLHARTHTHTQSTQNNTINLGRVRAVPRVCDLYPGICLTTEEKTWKNLSLGSRRVPAGTIKTEYTGQNIHSNKNT